MNRKRLRTETRRWMVVDSEVVCWRVQRETKTTIRQNTGRRGQIKGTLGGKRYQRGPRLSTSGVAAVGQLFSKDAHDRHAVRHRSPPFATGARWPVEVIARFGRRSDFVLPVPSTDNRRTTRRRKKHSIGRVKVKREPNGRKGSERKNK